MIEVSEGLFETHEYLELLRTETHPEFAVSVEQYEEKYRLPALKREREDALPEEETTELPEIVAVDGTPREKPKKKEPSKQKGNKKK